MLQLSYPTLFSRQLLNTGSPCTNSARRNLAPSCSSGNSNDNTIGRNKKVGWFVRRMRLVILSATGDIIRYLARVGSVAAGMHQDLNIYVAEAS